MASEGRGTSYAVKGLRFHDTQLVFLGPPVRPLYSRWFAGSLFDVPEIIIYGVPNETKITFVSGICYRAPTMKDPMVFPLQKGDQSVQDRGVRRTSWTRHRSVQAVGRFKPETRTKALVWLV